VNAAMQVARMGTPVEVWRLGCDLYSQREFAA
jgi:hypothetical protein